MVMGRLLRPEQHPALADVQESPRRAPRVAAEGGRVAAVEGRGACRGTKFRLKFREI